MPENLQADAQPGVASLVGGILEDAQKLVRQEVALAQREVAQAWDKAKMGVALLASALTVLGVAGVFLGFMLVTLLQRYLLPNHEWVCLGLVGGMAAILGGALVFCGFNQINQVHLSLPQTVETLREDAQAVSDAVSGGSTLNTRTLETIRSTFMDAVPDLAEQETDEMRQEIDVTRSAMADKLEALEDRVMGTVQSAQETVEESVQMAKDTVATVKRNFDIKYQVEQHPWVMVGGCFLAGLAVGGLFLTVRRRSREAPDHLTRNETPRAETPRFSADPRSNGNVDTTAPTPKPHSMAPDRPGFFGQFQEEIDRVKGMAIGYVMSLARDSIKDAVPQLASQIDEVMNSVTTKLGSRPVPQRST